MTVRPLIANAAARLHATVVLPSRGPLEVTISVFVCDGSIARSTLARSARNASTASGGSPVDITSRSAALRTRSSGICPSRRRPVERSTSSTRRRRRSKASTAKASRAPTIAPSRIPSTMLRNGFGRTLSGSDVSTTEPCAEASACEHLQAVALLVERLLQRLGLRALVRERRDLAVQVLHRLPVALGGEGAPVGEVGLGVRRRHALGGLRVRAAAVEDEQAGALVDRDLRVLR